MCCMHQNVANKNVFKCCLKASWVTAGSCTQAGKKFHTDVQSIIIFMPLYFIPRVLKLAKVKMYIQNGYDGDLESVNVLARHTALKH